MGGIKSGGVCECVVSTLMVLGIFVIFRQTGILDRILLKLGYIPTRGLREKLADSKIPNWKIPPEWTMLRSRHNGTYMNISDELEGQDHENNTEMTFSTENYTTVFYWLAR